MARDVADEFEEVICQDHAHCAHCAQYLLGWNCLRYLDGTYYCGIECAVEHDEDMDKELRDCEH